MGHSKKNFKSGVNPRKIVISKEQIEMLYSEGLTMEDIAKKLGTTKRVIHLRMQEYNIPRRKTVGKNHGSWKGGKIIKNGYPATYNPEHPRAMKIGYVYDHILVGEKILGRTPRRSEPIHHIDFDRKNSNEDNLIICRNHREHGLIHSSADKIIGILIRKGIVRFDKEKLEYQLA
ncbi:MAG: hypothetical protein ACTSRC_22460 [Candidatus Helarchaeota archaeon]